jgi:LCP family protein required for cell wall assembly
VSAIGGAPEPAPRVGLGVLKRAALAALLIVLASAATVTTAVRLEVDDSVRIFQESSSPLSPSVDSALADVEPGKPQTIALLGSDRRAEDVRTGKKARSDTIMLVRLDPEKEATAVMSIPRDLVVDIPGHGRDKINAAFEEGGPQLTLKTLKEALGITVHHVVVVRFDAFAKAVNELGCVYVDVDQRYFNDVTGPGGYAAIDIKPGYQRLCGQDSLDFVRYRHTDNDFVRAARQQEYLAQAKQQIGVGKLFDDREELLRIFGEYTQTDRRLRERDEILRIARLTYEATRLPIREVPFRAYIDPDNYGYVRITDEALRRSVDEFLQVRSGADGRPTRRESRTDAGSSSSQRPARRRPRRDDGKLAPGLVEAKREGEDHVAAMTARAKLPVYFPGVRVASGGYRPESPRLYTIRDRGRARYPAYRLVLGLSSDQPGQYYGVQGTTWTSPPILDPPYDEERMRGRTYRVFYDGRRISRIAWRTGNGVYWVSNTLNRELSNAQMRDIARSLTRVGA